ncbi:MAG: streptothricin acetyltransferase [Devosia sp.]|uniref:GNAT family N-acetyltransferase n=1 Tax=Devosia sp. TaxID=1871048 RepID=UPI00261ED979|nr:GNAT family N-acetyltransferase [Devosia sp.]MDB5542320.1 streptothricin acetyltransferase [Devosia sp.]
MTKLNHDVSIVLATAELLRELAKLDYSFQIEEEATPPFDGSDVVRTVTRKPYRKAYSFDARSLAAHQRNPDQAVFVALSGERPVGFIAVGKSWNSLATIADFAVDRGARRRQVGRLLMDAAVIWVRDQRMRGIRLETQSNNLPACRFYASYGFRLGGFDRLLYVAIDGVETETALFWYLFLDSLGVPDR